MSEPIDPNCDDNNPKIVKYEDVEAAVKLIGDAAGHTPCIRAHMSDKLNMNLYMKLETMHHTGCFKERGVRNTLLNLPEDQKQRGVITASLGNHAQALAYHSQLLKIPCIIVLPHSVPITKVLRCQRFDCKLVFHGNSICDAKFRALQLAQEKKYMYVNGYDHPHVIAGQGSAGVEVLQQVPNVDVVIVPTGGGSLLTGTAISIKHLKPSTEVYGAETDMTCSMSETFKKNERVTIDIPYTIADGLAVNKVGVNAFETLRQGIVDKLVVVKEDWVTRSLMHLLDEEKLLFEGAGATPLACIIAGLLPNLNGKTVVVMCSGGNIDFATLSRALERGMTLVGRLMRFSVTVPDKHHSIPELVTLLTSNGAFIRDIRLGKTWYKGDIFFLEMEMAVELKGFDHIKEIMSVVKKNYKYYHFIDATEIRSGAGNDKENQTPCARSHCISLQKEYC